MYAKEELFEGGQNQPSDQRKTRNRPHRCDAQKSDRRPAGAALPFSEIGQRLTALFPNGWDWIYAAPPKQDQKPEWETIKTYPLSPIEMWSQHQNPDLLIGIRPGSTTRWGILDIDRHSQYHPAQNPAALQTIRNTLEDLGIVRTLLNQSSHSGGLHLYIPLPESVSSYWLSIALKYHLEAAGIQIRSGQCELFPNPKRYIPQGKGFSHFNGIRMPMQPGTGFIPLAPDLNPLAWTLEDWLNAFDNAAAQQDIRQLKHQIEEAKHNHKIRNHRNPHSIDTWRERIEQEKQQGWTGPGQTNEKLKLFGCEARVFLNMDSVQQIAEHIQQTAEYSPGFQEHSNHTQDIARRSQEIAQWAIRYYWPLGAAPTRTTGYHTPPEVANFSYHQAKREAAQERIKQAIAQHQHEGTLPETASERAKAIAQSARVSQQTLYKPFNKPLWHPDHIPAKSPEPLIEQAITQPKPKQPETEPAKQLQPLSNRGITQLLKYVGFVILHLLTGAVAALPPQGQRAALTAILAPEIQTGGSLRGEIAATQPLIANFADLKATLPASLQTKIAQAERQRKQDQTREQQRRQRALARQQGKALLSLSPTLDESERTLGIKLLPFPAVSPEIAFSTVESLPQRPPTAAEQSEFETWYALAERFKLVTDYHWDNREYWVEQKEQWHPYAELAGTFPFQYLQKHLGSLPQPSYPE